MIVLISKVHNFSCIIYELDILIMVNKFAFLPFFNFSHKNNSTLKNYFLSEYNLVILELNTEEKTSQKFFTFKMKSKLPVILINLLPLLYIVFGEHITSTKNIKMQNKMDSFNKSIWAVFTNNVEKKRCVFEKEKINFHNMTSATNYLALKFEKYFFKKSNNCSNKLKVNKNENNNNNTFMDDKIDGNVFIKLFRPKDFGESRVFHYSNDINNKSIESLQNETNKNNLNVLQYENNKNNKGEYKVYLTKYHVNFVEKSLTDNENDTEYRGENKSNKKNNEKINRIKNNIEKKKINNKIDRLKKFFYIKNTNVFADEEEGGGDVEEKKEEVDRKMKNIKHNNQKRNKKMRKEQEDWKKDKNAENNIEMEALNINVQIQEYRLKNGNQKKKNDESGNKKKEEKDRGGMKEDENEGEMKIPSAIVYMDSRANVSKDDDGGGKEGDEDGEEDGDARDDFAGGGGDNNNFDGDDNDQNNFENNNKMILNIRDTFEDMIEDESEWEKNQNHNKTKNTDKNKKYTNNNINKKYYKINKNNRRKKRETEDIRVEMEVEEEKEKGTVVGNLKNELHTILNNTETSAHTVRFQLLSYPIEPGHHCLNIDQSTGLISTTIKIDRDFICPGAVKCVLNYGVAMHLNRKVEIITLLVDVIDLNDNTPTFPEPLVHHTIPEFAHIDSSLVIPAASDPDSPFLAVQSYHLVELDAGMLKDSYRGVYGMRGYGHGRRGEGYSMSHGGSYGGEIDYDFHWDNYMNNFPYKKLNINDFKSLEKPSKFILKPKQTADGGTDLKLILIDKLDREEKSSYLLAVFAVDGGNPSNTGSTLINITVIDANDNSPVFENFSYEITTPENTPVGASIARVKAYDKDSGLNGKVTYKLAENTLAEFGHLFAIRPEKGEVYLKNNLDYETKQVYQLYITAADQGPDSISSRTSLTVRVEDVNDHSPEIKVSLLSLSLISYISLLFFFFHLFFSILFLLFLS